MKNARYLLADDPPEHAVGGLEHRDREAAVARDRRHLEADVAAADHDDARAGLQARVERVDVRDRAHVVHAREVGPRYGERPRATAGREQQLVVAQSATVVQA